MMLPSLLGNQNIKLPHKTIGISNSKFFHFNELRNEYQSNKRTKTSSSEGNSCLNENGKTRYIIKYISVY